MVESGNSKENSIIMVVVNENDTEEIDMAINVRR